MNPKTSEAIESAITALCNRFQVEDLDDDSVESVALDALQKARKELSRLDAVAARARLVAAAPQMLDALQIAADVLFLSEGYVTESEQNAPADRRKVSPLMARALSNARNVIAKATGEAIA